MNLQTPPPRPASPALVAPLAVFDLDGTLLRGDSFLPFLITFAYRRRRVWPLVVLPFVVLLYVCRLFSDRRAKERLLVAFFRGEQRTAVAEHAQWFCDHWAKSRLRTEVVARLREHQAAGHRVVLVSASPDVYVPAIGRMLGITEAVSTRVAVEGDRYDGLILGDNCKGPHKVEMLRAYLGRDAAPPGSASYGDSKSDLPILEWAQHGYFVKGGELIDLAAPDARKKIG